MVLYQQRSRRGVVDKLLTPRLACAKSGVTGFIHSFSSLSDEVHMTEAVGRTLNTEYAHTLSTKHRA